jgi:host factor-I protein
MKDIMDPIPAADSTGKENFSNRKLIRPTLARTDNHGNHNHANHSNHAAPLQMQERRDRPERHERPDRGERMERTERSEPRANDRPMSGGKRPAPPEQTHAENFYYQKQMQSRTSMVVVLRDGEEIRGTIEWYDKHCIKVNRDDGEPNVMIYKPAIKYMYKEGENER